MEDKKPTKTGKSRLRYDLLGSTAIIESRGTRAEAKRQALDLMRFDNRIGTVLIKAGPVTGRFRTRKLAYLAGVKRYMVEYRETAAHSGSTRERPSSPAGYRSRGLGY